MGIFDSMREPEFIKKSNDAEIQLEELKKLEPFLNEEGKRKIKQQIKNVEYGIVGEKNIEFELKNSHMPMYILHDIYFESDGLSAQIDYLVFTRKLCFIIECKNLYGNIEINDSGDFIRNIEINGKNKKEGIYSPITQNERHVELMHKMHLDRAKNIVKKFFVNKFDMDYYKPIVVLANPKSILNDKKAKKEIRDKIIRADRLISYIKTMENENKLAAFSDKQLLEQAKFYLSLHKEVPKDYISKYDEYKLNMDPIRVANNESMVIAEEKKDEPLSENDKIIDSNEFNDKLSMEESDIYKKLRFYRYNKSKELGIKPYFIYNDAQLRDLIKKMPKNKAELEKVSGFGKVKVEKYGDDILSIVKEFE